MTAPAQARGLRGLVGVLLAQAAALSANRLLVIAVPWFVLSTTGSVTQTGIVAFCQVAPYVLAQALSGPVIDRVGPRRVSIAGDLVAMAAIAAVPALHAVGALPLAALAGLLALAGAADGPATAAKGVFVPTVTRAAAQPLERGTGLVTAVERTATVVGPALAGLLIGAWGGARALWLAAALLAVASVVVTLVVRDPLREDDVQDAEGYRQRLRGGARWLRRDRLLRLVVAVLVVTNLLDQAFIAVLLPVWAREGGHGAEAVGFLIAVFGATSIAAALLAAAVGDRLPRRRVYLAGFVVGGLPRFAVLALGLPWWAVVAVFAVSGFASGFLNPVIGAVTYERIPPELLGRVRTLIGAVCWAGIPFGGLVGAAAVAGLGTSGALWLVGGLYLVATVAPAARREWSEMDHRPAESA